MHRLSLSFASESCSCSFKTAKHTDCCLPHGLSPFFPSFFFLFFFCFSFPPFLSFPYRWYQMLITAQIKSFHRIQWKLFPPSTSRHQRTQRVAQMFWSQSARFYEFSTHLLFHSVYQAFRPSLSIQRYILILPRLFPYFLHPLANEILLESPKLFDSIKIHLWKSIVIGEIIRRSNKYCGWKKILGIFFSQKRNSIFFLLR